MNCKWTDTREKRCNLGESHSIYVKCSNKGKPITKLVDASCNCCLPKLKTFILCDKHNRNINDPRRTR